MEKIQLSTSLFIIEVKNIMNASPFLKYRMGLVCLDIYLCEKDLRFLLWKLLVAYPASISSFNPDQNPSSLVHVFTSLCVPGKVDSTFKERGSLISLSTWHSLINYFKSRSRDKT